MKIALTLILAALLSTSASAAFVYKKPVTSAKCEAAACELSDRLNNKPPAFDPSTLIAQARVYLQGAATQHARELQFDRSTIENYVSGSRVPDQAALNAPAGEAAWQFSTTRQTQWFYAVAGGQGWQVLSQEQYGQLDSPSHASSGYLITAGSYSVQLSGLTSSACAAVNAARQSDVACAGGTLTATMTVPVRGLRITARNGFPGYTAPDYNTANWSWYVLMAGWPA